MSDILITGFTPFDGRKVNAAWIAAKAIKQSGVNPGLEIVEIPVIWGKPQKILQPLVKANCPVWLIALGEGREGWFDIETLACNKRNPRVDINQNLPPQPLIDANGPESRKSTFNALALQRELSFEGVAQTFPVRRSQSAGGFLCEEMLYVIEAFKAQYARLEHVLFVHIPPFGSELCVGGRRVKCDEKMLANFGLLLLEKTLDITASQEKAS